MIQASSQEGLRQGREQGVTVVPGALLGGGKGGKADINPESMGEALGGRDKALHL